MVEELTVSLRLQGHVTMMMEIEMGGGGEREGRLFGRLAFKGIWMGMG